MVKHQETLSGKPEKPFDNRETQGGIGVTADAAILRGNYSNLAIVSHSPMDFILDFMFQSPNGVILVSRVITNPSHIKRLAEAIIKNVTEYEKKFGKIDEAVGKD
jgi:hypothetical protein